MKNSLGEERESYAFYITHRVFPVLEDMVDDERSLDEKSETHGR